MHRSRFVACVIDSQTENVEEAAEFWGRALGRKVKPPTEGSPTYRELESRPDQPMMLVQQVSHPSRVHLDIETDDVDAEVKRLEALGARRVEFVKTWWVMEAPTGHRFCVVPPQREKQLTGANVWNDDGTLQST